MRDPQGRPKVICSKNLSTRFILFQDFNSTGIHKNIFVSPSSIYETLLIAYFGAGGETEAELSEVLGFEADNVTTSKDEVKKSYLFRRAFQVKNTYPRVARLIITLASGW